MRWLKDELYWVDVLIFTVEITLIQLVVCVLHAQNKETGVVFHV